MVCCLFGVHQTSAKQTVTTDQSRGSACDAWPLAKAKGMLHCACPVTLLCTLL